MHRFLVTRSKSIIPGSHTEGHSHTGEEQAHTEPHNLIGPPLVLGFLLMLLIDQCSGGHRKAGDFYWQHIEVAACSTAERRISKD